MEMFFANKHRIEVEHVCDGYAEGIDVDNVITEK
jgi:hypothetical protein